jgi:hypothetical protein
LPELQFYISLTFKGEASIKTAAQRAAAIKKIWKSRYLEM